MRFASIKKTLCLALAGMLSVGTPLMAAGPVEVRSTDIAITDGMLIGTVLNSAAKPVAGLNVHLMHSDKLIATVTSDKNGQFAIRGLRNGGHVVVVGNTQQPVRLWNEQSAPPASASRMAIVVDEEVVRGQQSCDDCSSNGMRKLLPIGIFMGGAIAATLATTLSADDSRNVTPASP